MIVGVWILAVSLAPAQKPAAKLLVTEENYPRALHFRQCEATDRYDSYEEWEDRFDDLMGIIGQALPYQLSDHHYRSIELAKNPEYFTRFKQRHPDQIILLHLNTNDQDPRNPGEDFHPGHWLYYEGAKILSDVPDVPAMYRRRFSEMVTTEIHVSDASLFTIDTGIRRSLKDDIGLCMLDADGKPNWNESEQVGLVSVDYDRNTIKVRRGLYGSRPRSFPAGRAYAAAHSTVGPYRPDGFLQWRYNYSTGCPRDEQGRNAADMVIKYLKRVVSPGGELYNIDGVALDVMFNTAGGGRNRLPDLDADGVGDDPRKDNSYAVGMIEFMRGLKEAFGDDRFVCADGFLLINQRAFGLINGSESEGWPNRRDWNVEDWSGGTNNLLFWYSNSVPPKLSYLNHAYYIGEDYSKIGAHHARLVMAASTLTNSIYVLSEAGPAGTPSTVLGYRPDPEDEFDDFWDELVMGTERKIGWLGKPLGPAVRMATLQTDELGGKGAPPSERLLGKLHGTGVTFTSEDGALKVESTSGSEVRFELRDVPCDGSELTVIVTARGEPIEGYPPEYSRVMVASVDKGLPFPSYRDREVKGPNRFASHLNQREFTSGFYFSNLDEDSVDLEFSVEGPEPIRITRLEAYSHPDAMYREFENGLVLANPSNDPYEFDLAELFPDQSFRKLRGSANQDPETNDGSQVGDTVELQGKDGLFLVRMC
jgi:hypothetical protein